MAFTKLGINWVSSLDFEIKRLDRERLQFSSGETKVTFYVEDMLDPYCLHIYDCSTAEPAVVEPEDAVIDMNVVRMKILSGLNFLGIPAEFDSCTDLEVS
jgi:hypothetical protein